jgi:hypothetical protein
MIYHHLNRHFAVIAAGANCGKVILKIILNP